MTNRDVLLVGDSPVDRGTARAAGSPFAWARYGFGAARFDDAPPGDACTSCLSRFDLIRRTRSACGDSHRWVTTLIEAHRRRRYRCRGDPSGLAPCSGRRTCCETRRAASSGYWDVRQSHAHAQRQLVGNFVDHQDRSVSSPDQRVDPAIERPRVQQIEPDDLRARIVHNGRALEALKTPPRSPAALHAQIVSHHDEPRVIRCVTERIS